MRRLYYVAESVEAAQAVADALQALGIPRLRLHVLSRDEAGLYTHNIHSANPIHQLDILHTAGRYALIGLLAGLLLAALLSGAFSMGWLALDIGWSGTLILAGIGLCFGAWEGGMIGLSRENYKIERFHDDIEAGRYLIMVDVSRQQRPLVKELMNFDFPHVPYRGGGTRSINIWDHAKVTYHQTTH
ncbi:MAG: hypothetical protein ACFHXK_03150 [bacterium]